KFIGIGILILCICVFSVPLIIILQKSLGDKFSHSNSKRSKEIQQLLIAAKNGNTQKIKKLLKSGVDINEYDYGGWGTALHQAVYDHDVNSVRLLVECGADVNKGNERGHSPLHAAMKWDPEHALDIAKILISNGADVNAGVKNELVPDGYVDTSEGKTPLHNAAGIWLFDDDLEIHSKIALVKLLLSHGANVNAKDGLGCTPLFKGLYTGHIDVMELLIDHGADVNAKNKVDGGTVLHDAAYDGDLESVKFLVSHGADVHARDFEGETPLHKAALSRCQDIVNYLSLHGADLLTPSKRNETPQDFLNEPNETDPILLSFSEDKVYTLIVTNGLDIRMKLKFELIDYDTIWFPLKPDIEGLDVSLKKWIEENAGKAKYKHIEKDYILTNFKNYNREYAGFIQDGKKYIVCNMVISVPDSVQQSLPRNSFSGIWDGGCAQLVTVFEAETKQVIGIRCNNR
ncbi:MAG: ankyrin repeat domain-containing protein, partial [Phycisphaerales bacterium]